jgi:hypothetical protein
MHCVTYAPLLDMLEQKNTKYTKYTKYTCDTGQTRNRLLAQWVI